MEKGHCTAIILAAGKGKRMGAQAPKQYLMLAGRPVLYYSLMTFQKSEIIDDIILVSAAGDEGYCKKNIVEKYGFTKVRAVTAGGEERYDSVMNALKLLPGAGYVFIHDAARPFVDEETILRAYGKVKETKACVVAVPSKDTVKISDGSGSIDYTPERGKVWIAQTPQVFENGLIKETYDKLMRVPHDAVTDDAMAVEVISGFKAALVEGSYDNIKITTREDLEAALAIAKRKYKIV